MFIHRFGSVRKNSCPGSTRFGLRFLGASWLGPVRFGFLFLPERGTPARTGFETTKSGAGEQFLRLDCKAKARVK